MLGGGDDISINIIVSHVTERCSAQMMMMKHEQVLETNIDKN